MVFLLNSIFSGKIVGNLLINELTKPTNSSLLKRITNNELKKKELKIIKVLKEYMVNSNRLHNVLLFDEYRLNRNF